MPDDSPHGLNGDDLVSKVAAGGEGGPGAAELSPSTEVVVREVAELVAASEAEFSVIVDVERGRNFAETDSRVELGFDSDITCEAA